MSTPEMVEGYFDGLRDDRGEIPDLTNRSDVYVHGWRNGRDDRIGQPRDTAENLRQAAREKLKA